MINKVSTVLECSRAFSLPMTIMSWLVVFTYAVLDSGNVSYGIFALIGICLAHLGTNVLDDYFDYKTLIKQEDFDRKEYLKNVQKTKCRYIICGMVKEWEVLLLGLIYMLIAGLIGLFFYIKCGTYVLYFALAGGIIGFLYSFISKIRLSEIAVALSYGPILFGGVYFVMTKSLCPEVFILSIPTMIMTTILIYIHTVMDFDFDLKEGHLTVANFFDSQLDSLVVLKVFLILAYLSPVLLCIFDITDWQVFGVYLTLPLALDLYKSMVDFSTEPDSVPEKKWFHFPMENMEMFKKIGAEAFMIRMYQSRNLMGYFALIISVALLLEAI